jgi:phosphatidylglycerol lysyltransferase
VSFRRALSLALPVVLLLAGGWAIDRELQGLSWHEVSAAVEAVPRLALLVAVLLTAADYLLLSAYDVLGLRYAGRELPFPRVALTAFTSYALGNSIGLAFLSSSSVRYRLYSQWGLSTVEVARVVAFTAVTLWLGLLPLAGAGLLVGTPVPMPRGAAVALGGAALAATAAYLVLAARGREVTLRGEPFRLPGAGLAVAQIALAVLDWLLAALVPWVLLPPGAIPFPAFAGLFVAAQAAGLVSQVPGGLGVFDGIVLATLAPEVPPAHIVSALVAYRAIYYAGPLVAAFALLAGNEVVFRRAAVSRVLRGARASFAPIVPSVAAGAALVAGTVLLVSGATPAEHERLHALRRIVPLPVLEASHLLGSVIGTALVLLARALARRVDAAWATAVALLAGGAAVSILKGLDWEEASIMALLLAAMLPFRRQFYRRGALLAERFSAGWAIAVAAIVGGSIWIGLFAFEHVGYSHELWLEFSLRADAPRTLRASFAAVALVSLVALARLLSPARHAPALPGEPELLRVEAVLPSAASSSAHLALMGDKALLFGERGDAFLMYGVEGRSWVSMGDPVGPPREATELAWQFRSLADRHGGWAVFYEVGADALPRYLDMGLALLKLGEEAIVPLRDFTLDGPARRALRQAWHRGARDGITFEVVSREAVPALLPTLRAISDAWLRDKAVREKGFSLGAFDPAYLARGPVALARHRDRVVAFANVWSGSPGGELSIDLMRYDAAAAPRTTMEFLFTSLLAWGRDAGYARFSLGMAPFSGFERRENAPLWTRLGALLFQHGENFYNFQGLRAFKEKFAPEWHPRYLAAPGGPLRLPVVLGNLAALVSRGPRAEGAK